MRTQPGIELRAFELTCSSDRGLPALRGVSFDVRSGEIVGVAGVDGNGQTELAEAIAGLRPAGGLLSLDGDTSFHPSPAAARRAGMAHLPEDRRWIARC